MAETRLFHVLPQVKETDLTQEDQEAIQSIISDLESYKALVERHDRQGLEQSRLGWWDEYMNILGCSERLELLNRLQKLSHEFKS